MRRAAGRLGGGRNGVPVRVAVGVPLLVLVMTCAGCSAARWWSEAEAPRRWEAVVVATYPHDPDAFTQGLEYHDGLLYESTGGHGTSWITASELKTGEVRRRVALPRAWFGEGIAVTGAELWQLTWRDNVALLRDRETLGVMERVSYDGEGWGLCHQESEGRLVMSDGTPRLTFRDPSSFSVLGRVTVTLTGEPLEELNELECVGSSVWANVWKRNELVRIDPTTGRVTDVVRVGKVHPEGVLNGIATLPNTDDLLITGKNWPSLYRVHLSPTR